MKIQRARTRGNQLPPECNVLWEPSRLGSRGAEVPLDTVVEMAVNHAENRRKETGLQWIVYIDLDGDMVYARKAIADSPINAEEYHRTAESEVDPL